MNNQEKHSPVSSPQARHHCAPTATPKPWKRTSQFPPSCSTAGELDRPASDETALEKFLCLPAHGVFCETVARLLPERVHHMLRATGRSMARRCCRCRQWPLIPVSVSIVTHLPISSTSPVEVLWVCRYVPRVYARSPETETSTASTLLEKVLETAVSASQDSNDFRRP